jgi:ribosomal protein S18 acetylase RimI-like enzyme
MELDNLSFEGFWQLDDDGLTNAIQATPSSRFRVAGKRTDESGIAAYAVTGRAGQHGYLQRVAVHPEHRREGYGRAVVLDGLRWLRRHGATQALVNTQRNNAGALALYESCGFRELPAGLCVMGRSL